MNRMLRRAALAAVTVSVGVVLFVADAPAQSPPSSVLSWPRSDAGYPHFWAPPGWSSTAKAIVCPGSHTILIQNLGANPVRLGPSDVSGLPSDPTGIKLAVGEAANWEVTTSTVFVEAEVPQVNDAGVALEVLCGIGPVR